MGVVAKRECVLKLCVREKVRERDRKKEREIMCCACETEKECLKVCECLR